MLRTFGAEYADSPMLSSQTNFLHSMQVKSRVRNSPSLGQSCASWGGDRWAWIRTMINRGNRITGRKSDFSTTPSNANGMSSHLGLNPGLRGEKWSPSGLLRVSCTWRATSWWCDCRRTTSRRRRGSRRLVDGRSQGEGRRDSRRGTRGSGFAPRPLLLDDGTRLCRPTGTLRRWVTDCSWAGDWTRPETV